MSVEDSVKRHTIMKLYISFDEKRGLFAYNTAFFKFPTAIRQGLLRDWILELVEFAAKMEDADEKGKFKEWAENVEGETWLEKSSVTKAH